MGGCEDGRPDTVTPRTPVRSLGSASIRTMSETRPSIALGARSSQVVWPFLWRALAYLLVGVALGLAGVYQLAGLIEQLLVRTAPNDPLAIVVVIALLTVVAAVATVSPALRAARIDPMLALRRE